MVTYTKIQVTSVTATVTRIRHYQESGPFGTIEDVTDWRVVGRVRFSPNRSPFTQPVELDLEL